MSKVPSELVEDVWTEMCARYQRHVSAGKTADPMGTVGTQRDDTSEMERGGRGRERVEERDCDSVKLAPSVLLPHEDMCVDSLQALLEQWTWEDSDCPLTDEGHVSDRNTTSGDRNAYQIQALVSYGVWLVLSKRLDKVCVVFFSVYIFDSVGNILGPIIC